MPPAPPTRSSQGGTIGVAQNSLGASGSASSLIYNALSAGSMSAAGGARRPAPEIVVPFDLPTTEQVDAWQQQQQQQPKSTRKRHYTNSSLPYDHQEEVTQSDKLLLSVQQASTLLQSLRQSRLLHLTSMLPIFSTRQRAGVTYPNSISLPRSLDARQPHLLLQLGRADVRMGPHIFARTKFWEVRQDETRLTTKPAASPPTPTARQAISPALVLRVNKRAANDAALQQLLHVAASGAATSEQLQILGTWIQGITEELRSEGVLIEDQPPPPTAAPSVQPHSVNAPATSASGSSSSSAASPPPRPPILVVEFRENPSARFVLPVWGACVSVERRQRQRSVLQGQAEGEVVIGEVVVSFALPPSLPSETELRTTPAVTVDKAKTSTATAPAAARVALTWRLGAVSETLWETFGRFPSARTLDTKGNPITPSAASLSDSARAQQTEKEQEMRRATVEEFVKLYRTMPPPSFLAHRVPSALIPAGLEEHLSDRFGVRVQMFATRPLAKRKAPASSTAVDEDFSFVGSATVASSSIVVPAKPVVKARASGGAGSGGMASTAASSSTATGMGGVMGSPAPSTAESNVEPKAKRKRHVATHNADGTRKACGACGTLTTPMWRRGPAGPSQLCNACGARWKAGRLVVPDVPPPPKLGETKKVRKSAAQPQTQQHQLHNPIQHHNHNHEASSTGTPAPPTASASAQSTPLMASTPLLGPPSHLGTPRLGTQSGLFAASAGAGVGLPLVGQVQLDAPGKRSTSTSLSKPNDARSLAPTTTSASATIALATTNKAPALTTTLPFVHVPPPPTQPPQAHPTFIDPRAVFPSSSSATTHSDPSGAGTGTGAGAEALPRPAVAPASPAPHTAANSESCNASPAQIDRFLQME